MNITAVEENLKASYRDVSRQYRQDDDVEVNTENHRRLHKRLAHVSRSFGRPISVLDAGCGSGRYFHCLENVNSLTGVDLSPDMLEAARSPVRSDAVAAREIKLLCESIYRTSFPRHSFDFIYSLGMFGNGAAVTHAICARFHKWLAPGGVLFFNAVHEDSQTPSERLRKKLRGWIYPLLPRRLKTALDQRAHKVPFFPVDERQLERILRESSFEDFEISREICRSPLWNVIHLECIARKH